MKWLTKELRAEIRERFQKNYLAPLTKKDVEEIAINLVSTVETIAKYAKENNEQHIQN